MTSRSLVIQRPARPSALALLFHGEGSDAYSFGPVGHALAAQMPRAFIVSVQAPTPRSVGPGWEWIPSCGSAEATPASQMQAALVDFVEGVRQWQRDAGVDASATTLVGFSQGALLALAATQLDHPLACEVIAIAGSFSKEPRIAPHCTSIHLLHGRDDPLVPVQSSLDAAYRLRALGAKVTIDTFGGLGQGVHDRVLQRSIELTSAWPGSAPDSRAADATTARRRRSSTAIDSSVRYS